VEYFCCFLLGRSKRGKNKKKIRVIRDHIQYNTKKNQKIKDQTGKRVRLFDWIFGVNKHNTQRARTHTQRKHVKINLCKSLSKINTHIVFSSEKEEFDL